MLPKLAAAATVVLLLLPTAALADPPENHGETEYEENVIFVPSPAEEEELQEAEPVDSWTIEAGE